MTIGTGTGNTISFSTIRDFYGDTNPVAISDFNRNTSNNTLVDATFVGASTATTSNASATKNDFGVTVANDSTSSTITGAGKPVSFTIDTGSGGGSTVTISLTNNNTDEGNATLTRGGSQILSTTGSTVTTTVNDGDVLTMSGSGNSNPVFSYPRLTRVYDVTFTNNNSTGDTYTLASSSTGHSTKSVYAAGESQQVKDNSASNSWTIAYDNVTGSGSGTAGDIGVTVAAGSNKAGSVSASGQDPSVTAPTISGISFVNAQASTSHGNDDSNQTVRIFRNGTQVAIFTQQDSTSSSVTYSGAISSGDIMSATGTGEGGETITVNYTTPTKSIVFANNGSSSLTLGSSSTGGARAIAASASATVQSGGSTNNESWAVLFGTGSGDCNVGIPATIGAGNPVNLNLFNTVTTPVG